MNDSYKSCLPELGEEYISLSGAPAQMVEPP